MTDFAKPMAEWAATIIELIGVGLLGLSVLYVLGHAVLALIRGADTSEVL